MASQRSRLAADWAPSEEEIAATRAAEDYSFTPDVAEELDPRWMIGGKSHQPYAKYESDEEEAAAKESRLDRVRWTQAADEAKDARIVLPTGYVDSEAEKMLQNENIVVRGSGGGSKNKNDNRKIFKPTRAVIVEEKPLCAVVPFCVGKITRGSMWYYRAHPQAPRSLLIQLADSIRKGEIAKTIPYKRDEVKRKTWRMVIWLPDSSITDALRTRKRVASLFLNAAAIERGGEKVTYLNSWDAMPNALAHEGKTSYDGGAELGQ